MRLQKLPPTSAMLPSSFRWTNFTLFSASKYCAKVLMAAFVSSWSSYFSESEKQIDFQFLVKNNTCRSYVNTNDGNNCQQVEDVFHLANRNGEEENFD